MTTIHMRRIKSGVLADGCNSAMAAMFNILPMTTVSQNNGVIQLTGLASRHMTFYIAGILVLLGLFPAVGAVLQLMPKPVLGGVTLVMLGTVAVAGINILSEARLHTSLQNPQDDSTAYAPNSSSRELNTPRVATKRQRFA